MIETGRAVFYLSEPSKPRPPGSLTHAGWTVSNWPGSLSFKCTDLSKSKRPGFGGMYPREDFHFNGPDGFVWHGFRQGHHTQIAHCKRTKRKA